MEKGQGKGTDTLQTDNVFAHKEYIEREAAYNAIVRNYAVDDQLSDLDKIPAADVRPVVRGRWSKELGKVETEGGSVTLVYPQCSECGFIATWSSPYCPHCGAEMEKS